MDAVQLQSEVPLQAVELYDAFGRRLRSRTLQGARRAVIHREGLPAGLYLLRLRSGERFATRSIIWSEN